MIFAANSLPLPKTSRTTWTMSSAWQSSLAKMSVFGTVVRPGNSSVNSRSRNAEMTERIWSGATTARSSWFGDVGIRLVNCLPPGLAGLAVAVPGPVALLQGATLALVIWVSIS